MADTRLAAAGVDRSVTVLPPSSISTSPIALRIRHYSDTPGVKMLRFRLVVEMAMPICTTVSPAVRSATG
jgi:hypothetical protein